MMVVPSLRFQALTKLVSIGISDYNIAFLSYSSEVCVAVQNESAILSSPCGGFVGIRG
jgi:hypothetical protein